MIDQALCAGGFVCIGVAIASPFAVAVFMGLAGVALVAAGLLVRHRT